MRHRLAALFLLLINILLTPDPARAQVPTGMPAAATADDAFQAKILLALSDANMVPSAYLDGKPGPVAGTDVLNVLALDGHQAAPVSVRTRPFPTVRFPSGKLKLTVHPVLYACCSAGSLRSPICCRHMA
ncbi:hypothetical protein A0257_06625 [Hymenobacter psoromatis]|nr:hypothetical protein A0257_06625 [Hymenobacter psoromatis]